MPKPTLRECKQLVAEKSHGRLIINARGRLVSAKASRAGKKSPLAKSKSPKKSATRKSKRVVARK